MVWQIDWGSDPMIFGFDFAGLLIQGIEDGMAELEFMQEHGRFCDACGEFRLTATVDCNDETPTDRGTEHRLMPYELCHECRKEMFRDDLPF